MKADIRVVQGRFYVKTRYSPVLVEAWRAVPGRQWHPTTKEDSFPVDRFAILAVCDALGMLPQMLPDELRRVARPVNESLAKVELDMSVLAGHKFITEPYDHQRRNLATLLTHPRWLICDEMGTGKTHAVANLLNHLNAKHQGALVGGPGEYTALVVCPKSVMSTWLDQLLEHGGIKGRLADASSLTFMRSGVWIINYEKLLRANLETIDRFDIVVLDECHPARTMVETLTVPKPIEELQVGDWILGERGGHIVPTRIKSIGRRLTTEPFVVVNSCPMTPLHPVWTSRGYIPAKFVTALDSVAHIDLNNPHEELRTVQAQVQVEMPGMRSAILFSESDAERQTKTVLRNDLLGKMENATTGCAQEAISPIGAEKDEPLDRAKMERSGMEVDAGTAPIFVQPPQSISAKKAKEIWENSEARRQREASAEGAEDAGNTTRMADGGFCFAWPQDTGFSDELQNRHREPGEEIRSGGQRLQPQQPSASGMGQEKKDGTCQAGVENHRGEESRCHQESGQGCSVHSEALPPVMVYNLETETGNYFANKLLVHNCHRVKNFTAQTSRVVRRITAAASRVVALSGTPAPNGLQDWLGVIAATDPHLLPVNTKTAFENRYCVKKQIAPGGPWIISGYKNVEELHEYVAKISSRVCKSECLDLPEKVYHTRRVKLEGEQARIYRELKKDAIARLKSSRELLHQKAIAACGSASDPVWRQPPEKQREAEDAFEQRDVLTVKNVLTESLRLLQVVGGFVPDDGGGINELDDKAKVTALREVVEESDGRQVVVWACFRPEVEFLANTLAEYGDAVTFHGDTSTKDRAAAIEAFRDGNVRFFVGTPSAGGLGVNGLQVADTEVFYSRNWNLAEYLQSQDRLHRIGQQNTVNVVKLVAEGTVDERVDQALDKKASLQDMMMMRPEELL